ncbi:MAG: sulfotransferase domain-containing protein [Pseudomonadota bacterium]
MSEHLQDFALPGAKFSVSARKVSPYLDMGSYLKLYYPYVGAANIDSAFGFVLFPSLLYGGRPYDSRRAMTNIHLAQLKELGVKLSLNLTNHYFDEALYEQSRPLLERHHVAGNSITCTSNPLARRIKRDYPHYLVRGSILKKINTREKIERALEIYDQIVLPMEKNDDDELLESLPFKDRIMLFANATCGYACPDRTCWLGVSQQNQGRKETADCTKTAAERQAFGKAFFDVGKLYRMGYRHFKLIPAFASLHAEEVARRFAGRTPADDLLERYLDKPAVYLCSFPKSGRTWLRYLLAHYLNLRFQLGLSIDFRTFFQLIPHDILDEEKGVGVYDYYDDTRFPLVLASHDAFSEDKFGLKKIVFLLRSPLDTVVSRYFQHARVFTDDRSWKGSIKEFIRSEKGIAAYCTHLNSWADFLAGNRSVHILSYEAMHRDIVGSVRGVLEFMGIPIEEGNLAQAISLSSFEAMQEVETRTRIPGFNFSFSADDPESTRVRKGKVGGYSAYLDEDDIAYVQAFCEEKLTPQSKELLMTYSERLAETSLIA